MNSSIRKIKGYLLITTGSFSLGLGIIGIFLPLLPTTPFLLLTAYCYLRSSPKLYRWLINQPQIGQYIINFNTYQIIPIKAKVSSISLLWTSILFCIFYVTELLWLRVLLLLIAIGVTIHILSFKSKKDSNVVNISADPHNDKKSEK